MIEKRERLDTVFNGICQVPAVNIEYKGYNIKPKLDFGGTYYKFEPNSYGKGYIIVKEGANVAPGGSWASSILEAKHMIDCMIKSKGNSNVFYSLIYEANGQDKYIEV